MVLSREILCHGSTYCCSITEWNFWSVFQPQSSHIIRHSAEQRREGNKFWLLFWIRKWLPMLLHSQVLTISIKSIFFHHLYFTKGEKNLQSSYLMLFCFTVKLLCNRWTFCGVSENTLSCTSLPWVTVAVLGCCMYSSLVKSMLAFLTPTIHTTLHL